MIAQMVRACYCRKGQHLPEAAHAARMDGGIAHGVGRRLLRRLLLLLLLLQPSRPAEEAGEGAALAAKEAAAPA